MELLILIGLALIVITTLSVIVEELAEARGRNRWAWIIASLVGLAFAFVGWLVVVGALVVAGSPSDGHHTGHRHLHLPSRP